MTATQPAQIQMVVIATFAERLPVIQLQRLTWWGAHTMAPAQLAGVPLSLSDESLNFTGYAAALTVAATPFESPCAGEGHTWQAYRKKC